MQPSHQLRYPRFPGRSLSSNRQRLTLLVMQRKEIALERKRLHIHAAPVHDERGGGVGEKEPGKRSEAWISSRSRSKNLFLLDILQQPAGSLKTTCVAPCHPSVGHSRGNCERDEGSCTLNRLMILKQQLTLQVADNLSPESLTAHKEDQRLQRPAQISRRFRPRDQDAPTPIQRVWLVGET